MHPFLQSYRLMLRLVRDLIGHVRADPRLGGGLEEHRKAQVVWGVAQRLKAGVRMVEAYLRRVLLMMALELEPGLSTVRRPMPDRPDGHKTAPQPIRFVVLDESYSAYTGAVHERLQEARRKRRYGRRAARRLRRGALIQLARLHKRLEILAGIAANPITRARRLAYYLARRREGVIIAPDLHYKPPGYLRRYWTTEPSLTFDLMGYEILQKSKERPPPLPGLRTRGPRITLLSWGPRWRGPCGVMVDAQGWMLD